MSRCARCRKPLADGAGAMCSRCENGAPPDRIGAAFAAGLREMRSDIEAGKMDGHPWLALRRLAAGEPRGGADGDGADGDGAGRRGRAEGAR